jgi:NodT family efflux transporter outer membrane factor (OMF) lipoprotein
MRSPMALLLTCMLCACAVGPDYQTPAMSLPAQWGQAPARAPYKAPELAQWWRRLTDPLLTALIDAAVADNLDVATAKARVREARASYRQTLGTLLPSLTGNATATRGDDGSNVGNGGDVTVSGPYTQYQAGFDASWELDLFGANRRGAEAALYAEQGAQDELRATLLTLIGDIASNYVSARGYQARIALARRTAATQRETAALTRRKFDAGGASALDVSNAEGLAAGTEADITTLETSYAQAVHRLSVLTGRPPTALTGRLAATAPIPAPPVRQPLGVPADILTARPDVRQAERQLAQSTALIGQAEAARYPSVSLTGSVNTTGTKLGDLAKGSTISWSFGPSLTVPLFNGGQLQAAVEVTQAQRDQSFTAYRAAVLTALEDVENAAVALQKERVRAAKLAQSASAYGEAARLARALYESGSTSFLDVLDAERSLYSAQDSLLQSKVAIATDYVALNKALGGGWTGFVDTSRPEIVDRMAPHPAKADFLPPQMSPQMPAEDPATHGQ